MGIGLRTDFGGGNGLLLGVDESGDRPLVRFAAECRNCPQAMWFHFRLSGIGGRGVRVVLANPEQTLGGADWSTNTLVARWAGRRWERTARPSPVNTPGGRIEWAWDIDGGADEIEVAHCYPYQPADLEATLTELAGVFKAEYIGQTLSGREMIRVYNRLADPTRPAALLTARHHAGEVPGSWVLDGLLRHVAGTPTLRRITWWAIPFVDLDDVVEGSYGKDPFPHDCNRSYGPSGPRRPEGGAVMGEAVRLRRGSSGMFFADLHGPAHAERATYVPARGWDEGSPINPIAHRFSEMLQAATPTDIRSPIAFITPRAGGNSRYPGMPSSQWAFRDLNVDAISLETSYQGNETTDYTIGDYRRIGAALANTIAEWVRTEWA
ncbi:MAG TPA: M14-type cytosolic carboxypeptidase [Phycisphaerae bacterium]|nr:M14-type cytosolic carboxypeptidase [Phycisphaerae bacterium]